MITVQSVIFLFSLISVTIAIIGSAAAQDVQKQTLFTNCNIFDGKSDKLVMNKSVLVEGNLIKRISGDDLKAANGATVINCGKRTLMPGLSDTHVHITFASIPQPQMLNGLAAYAFIRSTVDAEGMLMRGITSVRDMGGNTFGMKQAIDEGLVKGPRIYPSGAAITQTAGHFDFRYPNQDHIRFGGQRSKAEEYNHARVVDGVPEMLAAVRENLRHGASQIKLAAGGGYASPADPLLGNQFTQEEIKAAVDAAGDWGTYVTIHSYHPSAINRAINAGIKDVGHGQLLDGATLRLMADKGVFLSTQPFTVCNEPQLDAFSNSKLNQVCKGTEFVYQAAKKIPNLKITYGTDIFFNPHDLGDQVKMMERLLSWYEPIEILRMATSTAGELFKLSGKMRDPYPEGDLGVVAEGAYADLLLVDGDPLKDLSVVADANMIKVIMKDGKIYKNTLN